jgi:hypothetical protein
MTTTSFLRESNHVYSIEGYPNHGYYAGTTAEDLQLLVIVQFPHFLGIFFDQAGNLLDVQRRMLSSSTITMAEQMGIHEVFRTCGDRELSSWCNSLGFREGIIKVKRFFLADYSVGIADFSRTFQNVLSNPSEYSEDEQRIARNELDRWFKEGVFEFWLNDGTDLWIASNGEIESS